MKALKITLAIVVLASIAFFIRMSCVTPPSLKKVASATNAGFLEIIQNRIDSINKLPDNIFCKSFYTEINGQIDDYYKDGRLGNNAVENVQMRENYSKDLYTVYTEKFIKQSFYVFRNSKWRKEDLNFIRNEVMTLKAQKLNGEILLQSGTTNFKKFIEIQNILKKYDEIVNFISECKSFSYNQTGLDDHFPISEVVNRLTRSNTYLNNNLENEFVNNCSRLKIELEGIPQASFNAHVSYLDNKFNYWSGKHSIYKTQLAYKNSLYDKLKYDINELDNGVYNVSNFKIEYSRLLNKLDVESNEAYFHFSN